jgi:hypothetical protein
MGSPKGGKKQKDRETYAFFLNTYQREEKKKTKQSTCIFGGKNKCFPVQTRKHIDSKLLIKFRFLPIDLGRLNSEGKICGTGLIAALLAAH